MAPKRGRLEAKQQEEEQTPSRKQLKLVDEQEQEDDKESKTNSKDDYEINQKTAAKTDEENGVDVSKPQQQALVIVEEEDEEGLEKKPVINRLWSFTDEIAVLQALIDFNGDNNSKNQDDFYNFVKGKLNYTKFTKAQVKDKVQKLKKKYKNNLNKSSSAGSDPHFSNPHDLKCFQLSKRIWAHLDANNTNTGTSNAKAGCALVQQDIIRVADDDDYENKGMLVLKPKKEDKDFQRLYPHLIKAFEGECFPKVMPLDVFKTYLSKVDSVVLEEWDKKWKKVRLAETHAYLARLTLIQEHTNWFYNQMKSS